MRLKRKPLHKVQEARTNRMRLGHMLTAVPDQYLQQAIRLLDEAVLSSSDGIRSVFGQYRCAKPEMQNATVLALLDEVTIARARMREKGCYRALATSGESAPKSLDQRGARP